MNPIDLRSDTVTRPTESMMRALNAAALGDDVLGDDPTVTELEAVGAAKVGKESGLFVPSGTMGNQIAIATHTNPGDSVLVEDEAHILFYEAAGPAIFSGVVLRSVPTSDGVIDPMLLEKRIMTKSEHTPGSTLICLENTHNRQGGTVTPVSHHVVYREIADRSGLKIHLDGSRVFNASVSLGVDVRAITDHVDTVNICLSKGLGAPVGSLLCGPADFIKRARFWRKRMGGGMRQSGLLAACGIVALNEMVDRLADDHIRAQKLGEALVGLTGLTPQPAPTNILMVDTARPATEWIEELAANGVLCLSMGPHRVRIVFHKDVDDAGLERAINAFRKVCVAFA